MNMRFFFFIVVLGLIIAGIFWQEELEQSLVLMKEYFSSGMATSPMAGLLELEDIEITLPESSEIAEPESSEITGHGREETEVLEKDQEITEPEGAIAGVQTEDIAIPSHPKLSLLEIEERVNEISREADIISQKVEQERIKQLKLDEIEAEVDRIAGEVDIVSQKVAELVDVSQGGLAAIN